MLDDAPSSVYDFTRGKVSASAMPGIGRSGQGSSPAASSDTTVAAGILAMEYQDAYIDLARSPGAAASGHGAIDSLARLANATEKKVAVAHLVAAKEYAGPQAKLALRDEMPHAVAAYDKAVSCVREVMGSASQGRFQSFNADEVVEGLVNSLERNVDALLCLPRIRQSRDPYVYTHSVNVAVLLGAFALRTGKDRASVLVHTLAGLFHDIGKALLPVSLLNAKRTLSPTEQTLVTRHPMLGCELLASLPSVQTEVLLAALEHHERFDGSGYPKGISGTAISEIGHLSAIADAYDALSSRRPYKGAIVPHKTLGVLFQMRRKHFHAEMVERFVRLVGIYPVGSVVELKDGYRAVVSASNYANPMLPTVTLARDNQGGIMCRHECNMATDAVSGISRCLAPEVCGIDLCEALGIGL